MQARRFIIVPHGIEPACWQIYSKAGPRFWFTAGLYFASVLLCNALDEGQPETPSWSRTFLLMPSIKRFEEALQFARRNDRTWIPDLYQDPVTLGAYAKFDLFSMRSVLDGVAQEIKKRPRDQVRIAFERR